LKIEVLPKEYRKHHITVDVEEWFHIIGVKIPLIETWDSLEPTVERNTYKILDVLEQYNQKATFFFLGWVAKKYPKLVREVFNSGHEIASHGLYHKDVRLMSPEELLNDIKSTKLLLEDIISNMIYGYRSPAFSGHSKRFFEIVKEVGYEYDSSVFPAKRDTGNASAYPNVPFKLIFENKLELYEFPISVISYLGKRFPIGGGYFRAYPLWFTNKLIRKVNRENGYLMFYFHPREIDKNHPRLAIDSPVKKLKTYFGLNGFSRKMKFVLEQIHSNKIIDSITKGY